MRLEWLNSCVRRFWERGEKHSVGYSDDPGETLSDHLPLNGNGALSTFQEFASDAHSVWCADEVAARNLRVIRAVEEEADSALSIRTAGKVCLSP
jgi:hypothetical protein